MSPPQAVRRADLAGEGQGSAAGCKPCGTYVAYKAGCRCAACRKAFSTYYRRRERLIAYGRWEPYVDAAPVRAHVNALQAEGMGWKRIAAAAGLDTSIVWKLLYGDRARGMAPSRRVRPKTAEALLAVTLNLADAARVDATGTHRRLQALIANGWSGSRLGAEIGMTPANFWRMLEGREQVSAATARSVCDLYDRLWRTEPPAVTWQQRVAVTKTRNLASARGWLPPLAWDEDRLDDPTYSPTVVRGIGRPRDVDPVVVERLVGGEAVTSATRAERHEAFTQLLARGECLSRAATLVRISGATAKAWAAAAGREEAAG